MIDLEQVEAALGNMAWHFPAERADKLGRPQHASPSNVPPLTQYCTDRRAGRR